MFNFIFINAVGAVYLTVAAFLCMPSVMASGSSNGLAIVISRTLFALTLVMFTSTSGARVMGWIHYFQGGYDGLGLFRPFVFPSVCLIFYMVVFSLTLSR